MNENIKTCGDCIHYDVCADIDDGIQMCCTGYKGCDHFKDKSRYIELPCAVGDAIYRCSFERGEVWEWLIALIHIHPDEIIYVDDSENTFTKEDIGKTVFLTKEEAEQALFRKEDERK